MSAFYNDKKETAKIKEFIKPQQPNKPFGGAKPQNLERGSGKYLPVRGNSL